MTGASEVTVRLALAVPQLRQALVEKYDKPTSEDVTQDHNAFGDQVGTRFLIGSINPIPTQIFNGAVASLPSNPIGGIPRPTALPAANVAGRIAWEVRMPGRAWGRAWQTSGVSTFREELSSMKHPLTPFQGWRMFRTDSTGLAPWAIFYRPYGACGVGGQTGRGYFRFGTRLTQFAGLRENKTFSL
jgi:hypothetical protein